MLSVTASFVVAVATLPPYLVTNRGTLLIETPSGTTISVPENSTFMVNSLSIRLDFREVTLDNIGVFKDGFE